jgi:hypothetical protein
MEPAMELVTAKTTQELEAKLQPVFDRLSTEDRPASIAYVGFPIRGGESGYHFSAIVSGFSDSEAKGPS